jgi:hypothetical protein
VNYDGSYHGRTADDVRRYCADADLFINLSGGSWFWRDEYARIPRKVFIDSDPAFTQLAIAKAEPWYVEFFRGSITCSPSARTSARRRRRSRPARSPGTRPGSRSRSTTGSTDAPPGDRFTTVMTWQIESFTDVGGNKDQEFVEFIDLPSRTQQPFELAINGPQQLLREHGWDTVDAMACRARRGTIATSSIARRPSSASPSTPTSPAVPAGSATGPSATWPPAARRSCRTPAGRAHLPHGDGLLAFSTPTRRLPASTASTADYEQHARSAAEIARAHFRRGPRPDPLLDRSA